MRFGLLGSTQLTLKHSIVITLLVSGNVSWLFFFDNYFELIFQNAVGTYFWISIAQAIFFGFCAFSSIIGAIISKRINYANFFFLWITLGVVSTLLMLVIEGIIFSLIFSAILGTSFGLGFPLGVSLLIDRTEIGHRGKISGLVMLETFVMVFIALSLVSFLEFGLIEILLLGALIRSISFVTLLLDSCLKKNIKEISWTLIFTQKNFLFYFFPWLVFNLASGLTNFIWYGLTQETTYAQAYNVGSILQFIGTALVAMLSGFIADRFGRKHPIIIGVLLFGISYAILGLATSELSTITHLTTLGVAWGFLMVDYLVIPGDLAGSYSQEKYYAIATVLPFTVYMSLSALPRALGLTAPANILSPILSIMLFLSIIPVLYASETLPPSKIRRRKMKQQINKLEKILHESKK